jgi:hypothetical protein
MSRIYRARGDEARRERRNPGNIGSRPIAKQGHLWEVARDRPLTSANNRFASAVSGSTRSHLATTQLSATASGVTHSILGDLSRTIGQGTAAPGKDVAMDGPDPIEPELPVLRFDRTNAQNHALALAQRNSLLGAEDASQINSTNLGHPPPPLMKHSSQHAQPIILSVSKSTHCAVLLQFS